MRSETEIRQHSVLIKIDSFKPDQTFSDVSQLVAKRYKRAKEPFRSFGNVVVPVGALPQHAVQALYLRICKMNEINGVTIVRRK